jgi:uncharacterized protein YheU (UPF0270 family)
MWRAQDVADESLEKKQEPVVIPYRELSPDALRGVIESFVLREGTDYGAREFALEQKVAHIMAQLERGDVQIQFDADSESVQIAKAATRCAGPDTHEHSQDT